MDSAPRTSATDSARTTANGNGRHGLIDRARVAGGGTVRRVQQGRQRAEIELQQSAKRNLDYNTQLQTNHVLQLVVGTLVLAVTGFAVFGYRTRRRRSTAEQLARKLKLNDLRDRLEEFRDDAKAWASAQKRIV